MTRKEIRQVIADLQTVLVRLAQLIELLEKELMEEIKQDEKKETRH